GPAHHAAGGRRRHAAGRPGGLRLPARQGPRPRGRGGLARGGGAGRAGLRARRGRPGRGRGGRSDLGRRRRRHRSGTGDVSTTAPATGPARAGRQRDPAADEAILAATLELLAEGGYGTLTVAAVIERAGVSSATLYRRFATK